MYADTQAQAAESTQSPRNGRAEKKPADDVVTPIIGK